MAHNINDNRMFYFGETPWHGIGVKLNHPATSMEAIQAARLDYVIEQEKIQTISGKDIQDVLANVRIDTGEVLGIIGDRYKVIQNTEAFTFFDSLVGEKLAMYHTAGALGRGERIWILAKLPEDILITKDDVVEKYLLLTNSHDGTSSLRVYFTPIRVVCQNTLIMSYRDFKNGVSITHRGNIRTKTNEARRVLGLAINYYTRFSNDMHALLKYKMSDKELNLYFDYVLRGSNNEPVVETTRFKNEKDILNHLFISGKGNNLPEVRGSAWAGYNATTEYADYMRIAKNSRTNKSNRLNSIWFGSSAQLKKRALQKILEIVKIEK